MLQEELTANLRHLAAELDEFAKNGKPRPTSFPELADFEPISLLGCGGMGAVYVARQISLGRDVAVKVVSTSNTYANCATMPNEARTVAQLHHPNIVQVFSAGVKTDSMWFAMELVNGKSADKRTFSSLEEVTRIGIAVAEALAYAHQCGIIHRDIKPSNIFVDKDGMAKLGDFGLACISAEGIKDKSGTKRYMAPEVLNGDEITEASDQYSLGMTLRELADSIIHSVPRFVTDFTAICDKATAHIPTRRYRSVEAMLADLRRFIAHEPVTANPPSPLRRFRLFARRNSIAALGTSAAIFSLLAFAVSIPSLLDI